MSFDLLFYKEMKIWNWWFCFPPAWNGTSLSWGALGGQNKHAKGPTPTTVAHVYWKGKTGRELFPGSFADETHPASKGTVPLPSKHCCFLSPAMLRMCLFLYMSHPLCFNIHQKRENTKQWVVTRGSIKLAARWTHRHSLQRESQYSSPPSTAAAIQTR